MSRFDIGDNVFWLIFWFMAFIIIGFIAFGFIKSSIDYYSKVKVIDKYVIEVRCADRELKIFNHDHVEIEKK